MKIEDKIYIPSPFMQPPHKPQQDLFDNLPSKYIDNPMGDFQDSEVRGMWEDMRLNQMEMKIREAEHNE